MNLVRERNDLYNKCKSNVIRSTEDIAFVIEADSRVEIHRFSCSDKQFYLGQCLLIKTTLSKSLSISREREKLGEMCLAKGRACFDDCML